MKIHGGISLIGPNAKIKNFDLEEFASDPTIVDSGNVWYNTTEKRINYVESENPVSVKHIAHTDDIVSLTDAVSSVATDVAAIDASLAGVQAVLETSRTITMTGDVNGSAELKSGNNTTMNVELPITGVTPGAYGNNKKIATINIDDKGRVLSASNIAYAPNILDVQGGLGWRDITADLVSKGTIDSPSMAPFQGLFNAYKFSASKINSLYTSFHIPHDYAPNTAVFFHIHWSDASAVPTGMVRWGFEYAIAKGHGQEAFPLTNTVYVEQACTASYFHMVGEVSQGIVSASLEPDAMILMRVFRDVDHPVDNSPAGVFAFTCDVHYQTDRFATINRSPNFYG